jgi:phosphoribosylglycinamide formyltransferase 1
MSFSFFLITETHFHASYLVTKWIEQFSSVEELRGIIVREAPLSDQVRYMRERFHKELAGRRQLTEREWMRLQELYPDLSETERAMIKLFGVSAHSATYHPGTIFLGSDLNTPHAEQWLTQVCRTSDKPFFFIFLDQLLASWWIELTDSQIINAHSAVLPYARGMFAIENLAISQDIKYFKRAAGASIFYIDSGIDTGPIIRSERLREPFRFDSIWELKGNTFIRQFQLLIQVVTDMLKEQGTVPVGIPQDPYLRGPNFNSRDFTPEARRRAEEGYLKMKAQEVVSIP